jgi:hypothetical protein
MAANDIDKSLAQAPRGIDSMMAEMANMEPDVEIEIEDPEEVTIKAGGMEIEIDPDEMDDGFNDNLAEEIDEDTLQSLASDLLEDYEGDLTARRDWLDTYVDGLDY